MSIHTSSHSVNPLPVPVFSFRSPSEPPSEPPSPPPHPPPLPGTTSHSAEENPLTGLDPAMEPPTSLPALLDPAAPIPDFARASTQKIPEVDLPVFEPAPSLDSALPVRPLALPVVPDRLPDLPGGPAQNGPPGGFEPLPLDLTASRDVPEPPGKSPGSPRVVGEKVPVVGFEPVTGPLPPPEAPPTTPRPPPQKWKKILKKPPYPAPPVEKKHKKVPSILFFVRKLFF